MRSRPIPIAWRADGGALGLALAHGKGVVYSADGAERTGLLAVCPGFSPSQMLPDWSLAYTPADFTALLRLPGSGEEVCRLRGHEYGITGTSFSRDGTLFATGGSDRWAIVWATRPAAGFEKSEFLSAGGWNALSGDLLTAAKVRPGGGIDIVETTRRRLLRTCEVSTTDLRACALDAAGQRLLVGRADSSKVELYDTATGALLLTLRGDESPLAAAGFCGAGPVWAWFADRTVTIFDGSTGERMHKAGLNGGLGADPISPDGRWMAWPTGAGQEIALYDLLRDSPVRTLKGHTGHTLACAWHPDSRHFFSTAADASMRKWSVDESRPVGYFRWPVIQEIKPVVSPDGRFVSAAGGGVLRLILADTMTEFATLEPPGGLRWWIFSTDGRTMALHESDRGVSLVPLDPLEAARSLAPRELTPAEVNRFEVFPAEERDAYRTRWFEVHRSAYVFTMRGREFARSGDFEAARVQFERAAAILPRHWLVPYYRGAAALLQRAARPEGDPARALDEDAALADVALMLKYGIPAAEIRGLDEFRDLRGTPAFEEALRGRD
ncbi:MAG: hypothetical protein HUU15_19360 [Candidatus Brocadiae bacterium]|nr:hypothetical protein [Candidatus Brocadiia bacterium]